MLSLVIRQDIPFVIRPKTISLEQSCYERSQAIVVTSVYCLLFPTSENKDQKWILKSTSIVALALKFL